MPRKLKKKTNKKEIILTIIGNLNKLVNEEIEKNLNSYSIGVALHQNTKASLALVSS